MQSGNDTSLRSSASTGEAVQVLACATFAHLTCNMTHAATSALERT